MPLQALETGVDWKWETFDQYLDGLEGRIGVNAGFLVGHCALRRYVLGEEAVDAGVDPRGGRRPGAPAHRVARRPVAWACRPAGRSTHNDGDDNPVPSRAASEEEVLTLCDVVSAAPGHDARGHRRGLPQGIHRRRDRAPGPDERRANRPLNWNVLGRRGRPGPRRPSTSSSRRPGPVRSGGRVVALTMPIFADNNMSLGTFCALWLIPGWQDDPRRCPPRKRRPSCGTRRSGPRCGAAAQGTVFERLADFSNYRIGDTVAPENAQLRGPAGRPTSPPSGGRPRHVRSIEIAVGRRLQDRAVAAADRRHRRGLGRPRRGCGTEHDVLLGGSDAGAHLDRMLGLALPDPLPRRHPARPAAGPARAGRAADHRRAGPAVRSARTGAGSSRAALRRRRGRRPGHRRQRPGQRVFDLPGDSLRLTARSIGVHRVLVNGVVTIVDGESTGALAGTVLRSGRDTDTVATR